MAKYNNRLTVVDGITFDSKKEAKRYRELKLLERGKEISELERQVSYELIPKQKGERSVSYIADFRYKDRDGEVVVEDAKGVRTQVYILKRKLLLWVHGITIQEV